MSWRCFNAALAKPMSFQIVARRGLSSGSLELLNALSKLAEPHLQLFLPGHLGG